MVKQLQLSDMQKNVIQIFWNKWRSIDVFMILFASSHKATPTTECLEAQGIKLMGYSAYSPDLSFCNFWLFPKIKEQLRGKSWQDMNELRAAVPQEMKDLRKEDFYQYFEYWFERMNKYISVRGRYFEPT